MHWIYLIHEFHNLSWITEINELFHDILIYWDAPVCVWDRGEGDTVASQSMLAISYIKAHGTQTTQCSEENAGKYEEMTILVCIATNAASMKAQWARAAPALHTQPLLCCFGAHACGVKRASVLGASWIDIIQCLTYLILFEMQYFFREEPHSFPVNIVKIIVPVKCT